MPQVEQEKKKSNTKLRLLVAVVVFAVAFGGGFWLYREMLIRDHKAVVSAIERARGQVLDHKYDNALTTLDKVKPKARNKNDQLDLIYYRGVANFSKGDNAAAMTDFKALEAGGRLDYNIARQLGYNAEKTGDKTEAIRYYKRAIELVKASENPRAQIIEQELQHSVTKLEKTP